MGIPLGVPGALIPGGAAPAVPAGGGSVITDFDLTYDDPPPFIVDATEDVLYTIPIDPTRLPATGATWWLHVITSTGANSGTQRVRLGGVAGLEVWNRVSSSNAFQFLDLFITRVADDHCYVEGRSYLDTGTAALWNAQWFDADLTLIPATITAGFDLVFTTQRIGANYAYGRVQYWGMVMPLA